MESGKVKIWHSLVTRFGLFFIGLILLAIFASGFLIYQKASTIIAKLSQERIGHSSILAEQSFFSLLTEVENDISVLSQNAKLKAYAESPSPVLEEEITDLFYVTLKNKPNYFQIRLLSIKDHGQEIIRLDKVGNEVKFTNQEKLQNKSERPYYQEALKLNKGEFYFSPISLNEEFGVVSASLTPTIRATSLIYDESQIATGMVVINVDLRGLYHNLRSIMTSGIQLMLIDTEGQYLFASDMAKCFSKQLKSYERFDADFATPIAQLSTDSSRYETLFSKRGNAYISQIKALNYSVNEHKIYLVTSLREEVALSSVLYVKKYSYRIIPAVSIIALFLAILFIRMLAIRIGTITQAIGNYDQDLSDTLPLPQDRKDELGVLARTFHKMKSKINQQVEALETSLNQEQKAIKEKDEFLQNMSHELRTPLNAILGLTQLIKKNNPTPDQAPIIDAINRSAKSLAGLMYDILDHQKLLEGKVELKYTPAKFSELLSDIHSSYRFEAINKGLRFDLEIEENLKDAWIQTDPLRFSQIITNLVINAIKYTVTGAVLLTGKIEKDDVLVISISDTGVGIFPDNLEKIRDRFYQERKAESNVQDGFGLGLSIVKQLIGLFGGVLEVESEKDKGSIFQVKLPLTKAEKNTNHSNEKVAGVSLPTINKKATILHIEDDEAARLLIHQLFLSVNIELIQTNNLAYALQVLKKENLDLIISDVMLDHLDLAKDLIQIQQDYRIPIIVVSALETSIMKQISDHYLQKPFDLDHLIDLTLLLIGKSIFDQPRLESNYAQYDHNEVKIKKFLTLLISEFNTYLKRIDKAFDTQNENEWIAIRHKLITHIRDLELNNLNQLLPEKLSDLNAENLKSAKDMLSYDLCFFRNELRLL